MLIKTVRWDSTFFKQRIGRISTGNFDLKIFEKEKKRFELIYIECSSNTPVNIEWPFSNTLFEDRKLIYSKQINSNAILASEIKIYPDKIPCKSLIKLALQSGEFSRFKNDKNFKKNSYEHLYTKWIQNSTNKKLAFSVLVFGDLKNPEGFITLQKDGNAAHVGLFAVGHHTRSRGIGKKLMAAAEYYAQKHNFDTLNVTTQADNKLACKLYEKCGFTIQSSINTYHYWNKKNAHPF